LNGGHGKTLDPFEGDADEDMIQTTNFELRNSRAVKAEVPVHGT